MKYIDLFAGMGGFRTAFDSEGYECVFSSEWNNFASKAYEVLYGEKPAGDITKIDVNDIPEHDLVCAGIPCVAFSVAGRRAGMIHVCRDCGEERNITFEEYISKPKCVKCQGEIEPKDPQGVLFFEVARIALAKKPKVVLVENVKGLVGHDKGRTLEIMVDTLGSIGYTVDFEVLNSKFYGVPQNRERIFIVAVRNDLISAESWEVEGNTVVPKAKRRIGEWARTFNFDWPTNNTVTTRLRDILEAVVDEKYYLSEDKVARLVAQLEEREDPQVLRPQRTDYGKAVRKQYEAKEINESRHNMTVLQPRKDGICNTLTTVQKDNLLAEPFLIDDQGRTKKRLKALDICPTLRSESHGNEPKVVSPEMVGMCDIKGNESVRRVYSPDGVSPTLTTMGGGHREPKIAVDSSYHFPTPNDINNTLRTGGKGSLTAKHNYEHIAEPVSENQEPKLNIVGHSGSGDQKGYIYDTNGLMSTLTATDYKQPKQIVQEVRPVLTPDRMEKRQNGRRFKDDGEESFTLTTQDKHGVAVGSYPKYRIRKLTPLECFRLQGFPDEYYYKLKEAGISNSQLYKMIGNAVTVNVVKEIAVRLKVLLGGR